MNEDQSYRVRLRFTSLVALTTLVGFCAGVVSLPILLLLQIDRMSSDTWWPITVAFFVVAPPIAGAVNGALYGALGYPLYRWITKRINVHTYDGEFVLKSSPSSNT